MRGDQKRLPIAFYRTGSGREPVREWLKELDPEDRRMMGNDLQTLEYGWPIGMPLCRAIGSHKGLWEARSNLSSGRIARVLFCVTGGRMVLLHAFIKKTRKTPEHELNVAVERMKGDKDG
jgi:phage-related protein